MPNKKRKQQADVINLNTEPFAIEILEYAAMLHSTDDPDLSEEYTLRALKRSGVTGEHAVRKEHTVSYETSELKQHIGDKIQINGHNMDAVVWTISEVEGTKVKLTTDGKIGTMSIELATLKEVATFIASGKPVGKSLGDSSKVICVCDDCDTDVPIHRGHSKQCPVCGKQLSPCTGCTISELNLVCDKQSMTDSGNCFECPEHKLAMVDVIIEARLSAPYTSPVKVFSSTKTLSFDNGVSEFVRNLGSDFKTTTEKIFNRRDRNNAQADYVNRARKELA